MILKVPLLSFSLQLAAFQAVLMEGASALQRRELVVGEEEKGAREGLAWSVRATAGQQCPERHLPLHVWGTESWLWDST